MDQAELEKKLRAMEHRLLEKYLKDKRPLRLLPRLVAQLTEGEREKFFKIANFQRNSIESHVGILERTIANRKKV